MDNTLILRKLVWGVRRLRLRVSSPWSQSYTCPNRSVLAPVFISFSLSAQPPKLFCLMTGVSLQRRPDTVLALCWDLVSSMGEREWGSPLSVGPGHSNLTRFCKSKYFVLCLRLLCLFLIFSKFREGRIHLSITFTPSVSILLWYCFTFVCFSLVGVLEVLFCDSRSCCKQQYISKKIN